MHGTVKPQPREYNKWLITVTVMTGTLMMSISTSTVNVAIPYMQGSFEASVEEIAWVSTGFILSSVITMPLVAWMSSRFGRKRFYMANIILFIASSVLCGVAWDLTSIITFRIMQGFGAGTMFPVAQAILRETFPVEEQGIAMGIFGFGIMLGPAAGPILAGWLTDHYSWPWVFYLNVPIGSVALLMTANFIHDPPYLVREKGKIDFLGIVLMIIGFGTLQLMLERGEVNDWFTSRFIVILFTISLTGIVLFVIREIYTDKPAVNLRLLRNVTFASASVLGAVLGMGVMTGIFLMPLFLQKLIGYPAVDSGIALLPRSIALALAMPLAGRLYNSVGPVTLVGCGMLISGFSFWELSRLSLAVGFWDIFFPQFWQGVGFGLLFVPLTTAALARIDKPDMTAAAGLYNFFRQVASSIGLAVVASLLTRGVNKYRALLVGNISESRSMVQDWMQTVFGALSRQPDDQAVIQDTVLKLLDGEVMRQASVLSFNNVYYLSAWLYFCAIPFVILLRTKNGAAKEKDVG